MTVEERRDEEAPPRSRRVLLIVAALLFLLSMALAASGVGQKAGVLSDWQAWALGVTQGLTEFLPISSSGHLILVPWLGDWTYLSDNPDYNKTFDVALHAGTLVAVVAYFGRELWTLIVAGLGSLKRRSIRGQDERLAWCIVVATIPAAIIGGLGESAIDDRLGEPWQIAILLVVFGALLWYADSRPQRVGLEGVDLRSSVLVGIAQAVALAPGVSRSGATITMARWLGLDRDAAARLSFLMLFPVVLGAVVLKGLHVVQDGLPAGSAGPFVVGMLAAASTGLLAIAGLLAYVRTKDYMPFVIYRFVAAAAILVIIATGVRDATF
jgi:undecaprenyl-diphosphatase